MEIDPLHDRVAVEKEGVGDKTKGGLYLPDSVKEKEKPQRGKVIAVGSGFIREDGSVRPMSVKPGDIVYFGKYSGTDLEFEGKKVTIMHEADLLFRVK